MPRLLVVSQHARRYAQLIEAAQLPDLSAHYATTSEAAQAHCAEAEILFGAPDRLAPLLGQAASLQWVQSSWAGVKPLLDTGQGNYRLTGVKGIFGPLMSEYVLGWLLALERRILIRATHKHWDDSADSGLQGKQLGIMGTGSIGSHVAGTARSFGVLTRGLNSDGRDVAGFDTCYSQSRSNEFADGLDYLVALLPETSATNNLVNAELLGRLKIGAILINAGRANSIDEAALLEALHSGQLGHAVLDVTREEPLPPGDPLWQVNNLYITSHTSAPTGAEAIVEVFVANYHRYQAGEPLLYSIDFERGY